MCKAIDDIYNEGIGRGIEQGIEQGKEALIKAALDKGSKPESIADILGIPVVEILEIKEREE